MAATHAGEEEIFTDPNLELVAQEPADPLGVSLAYFPTAEGYYDYRNNKYIYQYKDHLGNVRLSYAKNSGTNQIEILDRNDYYAFGMNMYEQNSVYDAMGTPLNHKYNQKELQETGFYDYGWRQYMPDLGRWFGMDKLAESYSSFSPYAYVVNNPVMLVDPDGRKIKPTKDGWEFTGEDIADIYGYLTNGGNAGMLVNALSSWGEMRTGQDFWSFLDSWKPSGNSGVGGNIYTTTVGDGPVTGNAHEIQGIVFTKTKIAKVFSNHEILKETQASWRKGGGVMMMGGDILGISDIVGLFFSRMETKNKNAAILLGGLAIIATKGRASSSVLKAELAVEQAEIKTLAHYYPADGGALGNWTTKTLEVGAKIDRFGRDTGSYFSNFGTPIEMRALPPGNTGAYTAYEVVKPFSVQTSNIAPAFGKIGTGVQYYSPFLNASSLVDGGFLKIIP